MVGRDGMDETTLGIGDGSHGTCSVDDEVHVVGMHFLVGCYMLLLLALRLVFSGGH